MRVRHRPINVRLSSIGSSSSSSRRANRYFWPHIRMFYKVEIPRLDWIQTHKEIEHRILRPFHSDPSMRNLWHENRSVDRYIYYGLQVNFQVSNVYLCQNNKGLPFRSKFLSVKVGNNLQQRIPIHSDLSQCISDWKMLPISGRS